SAQKEKLEEEISLHSAGFYRTAPMTLQAIQSAIPADAALIEFIAYQPFNARAPDNDKAYGPSRYVAYVILKQGEVRWFELGPTKDLDAAIDAWRQSLRDPRRKDTEQLARAVDERIMRPVRRLTGGANHLLISPDGELNLMPFAALTDENGQHLIQRFSFTY